MNEYASVDDFKGRLPATTLADSQILSVLEAASRAVDNYCGRTFFASAGSKIFQTYGRRTVLVDDFQSATSVVLDGAALASSDYRLGPTNSATKNRLVLGDGIALGEESVLTITGAWGSTPDAIVKHATLEVAVEMANTLGGDDLQSESLGDYRYQRFGGTGNLEQRLGFYLGRYRRLA